MLMKLQLFPALSAVVAVLCATPCVALDLGTPEGKLQAMVKMRASADGSPAFADWRVTAFAVLPGQKPVAIFKLDGFNVGRMEKQPDGAYRFISREVAYYRDLVTRKIIDKWDNPYTKETNDVLQVINDPVNVYFPSPEKLPAGMLPFDVRGDDVVLQLDVPLGYPNPIKPDEYPVESTGPTYLASEHFLYFAKTSEVVDDKLAFTPTHYAWTRVGPWLPWMKMGKLPGWILYVGTGRKHASAAALDPVVREYTEKNHPKFMLPPDKFSPPNETSWTYYRKVFPPKVDAAKPSGDAPK